MTEKWRNNKHNNNNSDNPLTSRRTDGGNSRKVRNNHSTTNAFLISRLTLSVTEMCTYVGYLFVEKRRVYNLPRSPDLTSTSSSSPFKKEIKFQTIANCVNCTTRVVRQTSFF